MADRRCVVPGGDWVDGLPCDVISENNAVPQIPFILSDPVRLISFFCAAALNSRFY